MPDPLLSAPLDWGEEEPVHWSATWTRAESCLRARQASVRALFTVCVPSGHAPARWSCHARAGGSVCSLSLEKVETGVNANLFGRCSSWYRWASLFPPSTRRACGFRLFLDILLYVCFWGGCGGMGWGLSLFRMSPANSDYANHNSFLTFVYSVQGNTLSTYAHVLSLIPYSHPQAWLILSLFLSGKAPASHREANSLSWL